MSDDPKDITPTEGFRVKDPDDAEGSVVQPLYTERKMKLFLTTEHELRSLSMMNTLAIFCFSFAGSFFSFAWGIKIDIMLQEKITEKAELLRDVAVPILWVLAGVTAFIGAIALVQKSEIMKNIKDESKDLGKDA